MNKVLLILTGGTITMKKSPENFLDVPADQKSFSPELLRILEMVSGEVKVDVQFLYNIDSTNVEPACWELIADAVDSRYDDYDGFVVSHGTDTLAYTASAVSLILGKIGKPVVFTGSQLPLSNIYTDGTNNLINSLLLAGKYDIAETCILFGTNIIKATRARKVSAFDLQAFVSINSIQMGTIGLNFKFSPGITKKDPELRPEMNRGFNPNIAFITIHPGISPQMFRHMTENVDGIVLSGYGAGNVPERLTGEISRITDRGRPVVVCTQCMVGKIELALYKVGVELAKRGAISASDMTPECATVKLMWALFRDNNIEKIRECFRTDFAGELS